MFATQLNDLKQMFGLPNPLGFIPSSSYEAPSSGSGSPSSSYGVPGVPGVAPVKPSYGAPGTGGGNLPSYGAPGSTQNTGSSPDIER